jgi:hypothetical protein
MQPFPSADRTTSTEPLPVAQADVGMTVVDRDGEEVGSVTAVQMPGTGVRPDLPEAEAEHLMVTGYLLVGGGRLFASDLYVGGGQVDSVTTTDHDGVVTLTVSKDDLRRAG